jgi:hypothetical protein
MSNESDRSEEQGAPQLPAYQPPAEGQDDEWVPEEAIEALNMEKRVNPAESAEDMAERIFEENLPVAAQAITHLAVHSGNAAIRFKAAQYVVDRKLGKLTDPSNLNKGDKDPLVAWMEEITSERVPSGKE